MYFNFFPVLSTANDKGRMGCPAEERKRRKRAEAAGEARQRGETGPRRIKQREIYPLLLNSIYTVHPKVKI